MNTKHIPGHIPLYPDYDGTAGEDVSLHATTEHAAKIDSIKTDIAMQVSHVTFNFNYVTCITCCVTCNISHTTCYVLYVTCHV